MKHDANLAQVERVAGALGDLRERVAFLGGCAVGLLLTDPAAAPVREPAHPAGQQDDCSLLIQHRGASEEDFEDRERYAALRDLPIGVPDPPRLPVVRE